MENRKVTELDSAQISIQQDYMVNNGCFKPLLLGLICYTAKANQYTFPGNAWKTNFNIKTSLNMQHR